MRTRWVILILTGALIITSAVLMLHPALSATIGARVLGKTNSCYTVLITNRTRQFYYVEALTEFREYGAWNRKGLPPTGFLKPDEGIIIEVPDHFATRDGLRRIAVSYVHIDNSRLTRWIKKARALMGIPRNAVRKMYLDAP